MTSKRKIVVLTGAGISAESGLKTFRDTDGLWEGYPVYEVATPEGWNKNRKRVLEFYNERRKQARSAQPNAGHHSLAQLEDAFEVTIITQNVDNLHEKAGSTKVIHLHGELFRSRSTADPTLTFPIEGWKLDEGDLCPLGSQLRPDIVWFGEAVPLIDVAEAIVATADIMIIAGTSLQVYPAAGLSHYFPANKPLHLVDPNLPNLSRSGQIFTWAGKAGEQLPVLTKQLLSMSW